MKMPADELKRTKEALDKLQKSGQLKEIANLTREDSKGEIFQGDGCDDVPYRVG